MIYVVMMSYGEYDSFVEVAIAASTNEEKAEACRTKHQEMEPHYIATWEKLFDFYNKYIRSHRLEYKPGLPMPKSWNMPKKKKTKDQLAEEKVWTLACHEINDHNRALQVKWNADLDKAQRVFLLTTGIASDELNWYMENQRSDTASYEIREVEEV